jgi:hypothetical protein
MVTIQEEEDTAATGAYLAVFVATLEVAIRVDKIDKAVKAVETATIVDVDAVVAPTSCLNIARLAL